MAQSSQRKVPPQNPGRFNLKKRISGIFKYDVADSILREALELIIGGDNMAAAFVLSRGTPMPLDDAVDGLMEVEKVLINIVDKNKFKAQVSGDV